MEEIKREKHVQIVSEQTKADIIRNSVQGLSNQPILSAAEMKKQFVKPVVNGDGKPSAIGEVDRVAKEAEAAINEILALTQTAINAVLSEVAKFQGSIEANAMGVENLRVADVQINERIDSLRNMAMSDIQALAGRADEASAKLAEVEAIAKGASVPIVYDNYQAMIEDLNKASLTQYLRGNDIYFVATNAMDAWIAGVSEKYMPYEYSTNTALETAMEEGRLQVGHYILATLEGGKAHLKDYEKTETHKEDIKALLSLFPTIER